MSIHVADTPSHWVARWTCATTLWTASAARSRWRCTRTIRQSCACSGAARVPWNFRTNSSSARSRSPAPTSRTAQTSTRAVKFPRNQTTHIKIKERCHLMLVAFLLRWLLLSARSVHTESQLRLLPHHHLHPVSLHRRRVLGRLLDLPGRGARSHFARCDHCAVGHHSGLPWRSLTTKGLNNSSTRTYKPKLSITYPLKTKCENKPHTEHDQHSLDSPLCRCRT